MPEQVKQTGNSLEGIEIPDGGLEHGAVKADNTTAPIVPVQSSPSPGESLIQESFTPMKDDKTPLKLDDFAGVKDGVDLTKTIVDANKPKVEEKKDEKKVETVDTTKSTPITQKGDIGKQALAARDYSGIDEADLPVFKQMSKEAFEKIKPIYQSNKANVAEIAKRDTRIKELEAGGIPQSYYEHSAIV